MVTFPLAPSGIFTQGSPGLLRYQALRLRRREAVSSHYFGHLYAIRRPASRHVNDLRGGKIGDRSLLE